jgi:transposase-like protein
MQIECPGCRTRADVERDALTAQSFKWLCPECRRHWQVRTVFFEESGGPTGDEWRKLAKRLRLEQGMTQEQLGHLLGITAPATSKAAAVKAAQAKVSLMMRPLGYGCPHWL